MPKEDDNAAGLSEDSLIHPNILYYIEAIGIDNNLYHASMNVYDLAHRFMVRHPNGSECPLAEHPSFPHPLPLKRDYFEDEPDLMLIL